MLKLLVLISFINSGIFHSTEQIESANGAAKVISSLIVRQSSLENEDWEEASRKLFLVFDPNGTDFSIQCNHSQMHFDSTYREYFAIQRRRFKSLAEGFEPKFNIISVQPVKFELSFNLTSKMGFIVTEEYKIVTIQKDNGNVFIHRIVKSGACLDSPIIDKELIYSSWKAKTDTGKTSIDQFLVNIGNSIPFTSSVDMISPNFDAFIETDQNYIKSYDSNEFIQYMIEFTKHYKLRRDLKVLKSDPTRTAETTIITQQTDHVVLRTSVFFEYKLESNTFHDLFTFFIEAKYDSEWKISRIIMSPPSYFLNFDVFQRRSRGKTNIM